MAVAAGVGAIGRLAMTAGDVMLNKTAGAIDKLAIAGKTAMASITNLATSITGGLLSPLETVRQLVGTIGNLVGLFNPGIVTRFQLVLNDTLAVIGAGLVPVMQGLTIYVRTFGNVLAGLLPVLQPLFNAIGQYIANYGHGVVEIFQAAAPLIQVFADGMAVLLGHLSKGIAFLQGVVAELITMIAELFGLQSRFNANAKSEGFAARRTSVSSVEQFAADLFASTARNVYARQTPDAKKPEALLAEIKEAIVKGRELVKKIAGHVEELASFFLKKKEQADKVIGGVADGVVGAGVGAAVAAAIAALGAKKPW